MCLDKLRKFKIPVYGYKIFRVGKNTDELFSIYQGEPKAYPINKILDEKYFRTDYNKRQESLDDYPYGFHIFKILKFAKIRFRTTYRGYPNYAVYKVEIIEPHTTGIELLNDTYCHVIVSKKMRIIKKIC